MEDFTLPETWEKYTDTDLEFIHLHLAQVYENCVTHKHSDMWFCGYHLTELPLAIIEIEHLQRLVFCCCRLTKLPEAIGNMTWLRKLNIRNNKVQFIPVNIAKLVNLTTFDCGDNELKDVPSEIATLPKLEYFSCKSNPFLDPELKDVSETNTRDILEYLWKRLTRRRKSAHKCK